MTIKDIRREYYRTRARPETHELHVSKHDSMSLIVPFHAFCSDGSPLAVFTDEVKNGERTDLYFKRVQVKFFCDELTQFVCKELV